MNRDEFESKVLELWMKSRVPLTQTNLQYFAAVSPGTLASWIDQLLERRVIEIEVDEDGTVEYEVPGVLRAADGPDTCESYERKRAMVDQAKQRILARRAGTSIPPVAPNELSAGGQTHGRELALLEEDTQTGDGDDTNETGVIGLMGKAALMASGKALVALDKPLAMMDRPRAKGDKSLLASTGLSLFGPVGWLYAGSFREAIPATLAFVAVGSILPSVVLAPFLFVGSAASAVVGLTYGWLYNRKKGRTPLFLKGRQSKKDKKRKNASD